MYSSEEETDISDSELEEYADKCYKKLKNGGVAVRAADKSYQCPYCPGKKRMGYKKKDLLQHASGISGSQKRDTQERGKHLGLARYLENDQDEDGSSPQSVMVINEPYAHEDSNENFVWPWVGIVANIPVERQQNGKYVGRSGSRLREELARKGFNPVRVNPLWNYRGHSGYAVVEFTRDWPGFTNAMIFEKSYEAEHRGKKHYDAKTRWEFEDGLFGWVARDDDYYSEGIISDYLRKHGDLKTVSQVEEEEKIKTMKLMSNLTSTIEDKNSRIKEIVTKYHETTASLNKVMKEKDEMVQNYNAEVQKLQNNARQQLESILKQHRQTSLQLETKRNELEQFEEKLKKRENENEKQKRENEKGRQKLDLMKKKNERATLEQKRADENVLRLAEEHKREKEKCHKRILELEKQLDAKQALELEIERRRGALMVMEHMEGDEGDKGDEDKELWKKMKNMREELKDKEEELEMLEEMSQALIIKERKTNDELQEARKELKNFLKDKSSRAHIGVKRMGEIDSSAFQKAAKRRYPKGEAEDKAATICSTWESQLADPNWHPFKIVAVGGNNGHKEIIDKEDAKLRSLRDDLGDEAYNAVITALMELNEYNPSGRYPVLEIWNHKEARKATLREAVLDILKQWRMLKRKIH